jgi:hypothetical protein
LQHDVENGSHRQGTAPRALQRHRMMEMRSIDLANLTYVRFIEQATCFCNSVFNAEYLALPISSTLHLL